MRYTTLGQLLLGEPREERRAFIIPEGAEFRASTGEVLLKLPSEELMVQSLDWMGIRHFDAREEVS
jgi:hypothetical protein